MTKIKIEVSGGVNEATASIWAIRWNFLLTFGKSHFFTKTWLGFDGLTIWGVLPHSGRLFAGFLAGAFFFPE